MSQTKPGLLSRVMKGPARAAKERLWIDGANFSVDREIFKAKKCASRVRRRRSRRVRFSRRSRRGTALFFDLSRSQSNVSFAVKKGRLATGRVRSWVDDRSSSIHREREWTQEVRSAIPGGRRSLQNVTLGFDDRRRPVRGRLFSIDRARPAMHGRRPAKGRARERLHEGRLRSAVVALLNLNGYMSLLSSLGAPHSSRSAVPMVDGSA